MTEIDALAARVGARLRERRDTIGVSESSAGGLVAAALLAVPGASRYFIGGAVVYTAAARKALLAIGPDKRAGMRSPSEPYTQLLARRTLDSLGSSWGLAETGAAGPPGRPATA